MTVDEQLHVVVVGAGIGGLGSALAFARAGHRVTLIERDDTPMPADVEGAFEWQRRGAPQVRHPHAFLGLAPDDPARPLPRRPRGPHGPPACTPSPCRTSGDSHRCDRRGARCRRRPAAAGLPAHHLRVGAAPLRPRGTRRRPPASARASPGCSRQPGGGCAGRDRRPARRRHRGRCGLGGRQLPDVAATYPRGWPSTALACAETEQRRRRRLLLALLPVRGQRTIRLPRWDRWPGSPPASSVPTPAPTRSPPSSTRTTASCGPT